MPSAHTMCFYDETLKKQIEGFYKYDGKAIHVSSYVYGARSAPPRCFPFLGAFRITMQWSCLRNRY